MATVALLDVICSPTCVYAVRFAAGVASDLKKLRAGDRRRILDDIQHKLSHEPAKPTKRIKRLHKHVPPFEAVPLIWQRRTGDHPVFYDVDEAGQQVLVRAVRRKPPHRTTEEIL